jgi:hypothetical protein
MPHPQRLAQPIEQPRRRCGRSSNRLAFQRCSFRWLTQFRSHRSASKPLVPPRSIALSRKTKSRAPVHAAGRPGHDAISIRAYITFASGGPRPGTSDRGPVPRDFAGFSAAERGSSRVALRRAA